MIWCRLMTLPPSRTSGRVQGYRGVCFVFGDTAAHCSAHKNTQEFGTHQGQELKLTVWCAHTYTHTPIQTHTHRFMHSDEKRDRCMPPFQPAPHLGDGYFRKEHNIRTHIHSPLTHIPTSFPLAPSCHQLLSSLSF